MAETPPRIFTPKPIEPSMPLAPVADTKPAEPLPLSFFVGLILLVYGVIVVFSGLFVAPRPTVLAETRPALWWGGVMVVVGTVFLGLGIKGRRLTP